MSYVLSSFIVLQSVSDSQKRKTEHDSCSWVANGVFFDLILDVEIVELRQRISQCYATPSFTSYCSVQCHTRIRIKLAFLVTEETAFCRDTYERRITQEII